MCNEDGQTVWANLLKFRKAVSFLTDNRSSLVYVFPKKVAYLCGQVESGMVTLSKKSCIGEPTGRNFKICFGNVLFSLDEWILCSDNLNLQSTCPVDK